MADEAEIAKGYLPYNVEAEALKSRYAETPFADRHASFRAYYPKAPAHVLDVGAGIGVDSLGFAELGHKVVAAEPADGMRAIAVELRDHGNITWVKDHLPDLTEVSAMGQVFDFILLSASFMHLPLAAQRAGFATLASLTRQGGHVAMSLRHGPVPPGRTMFEIKDEDAIAMAACAGISCISKEHGTGRKQQPGVTWSSFVFEKP